MSVSPTYARVDTAQTEQSGGGLNLTLGRQIHPQWDLELGLSSIIDHNSRESQLSAEGITVSLLGKATGASGMLYYRLGLSYLRYQQSFTVEGCQNSENCAFSDGTLGGVVGLGFDTLLYPGLSLRTELVYAKAQHDLSFSQAVLGLKYYF